MARAVTDRLGAVMAAFDRGAERVLLRGTVAQAVDAVVAAFVAERSRSGKVLVLVPQALRDTYGSRLRNLRPVIHAGDWDSDAMVEVATPMHAGSRSGTRPVDAFVAVVIEQCHRANTPMIEAVATRFAAVPILEVVRQAEPATGNLAPDEEISLGTWG